MYFYYTNLPVPDGCGIFVNGSDSHRVDLRDGTVTEIIPHSGLWLALSPDESILAYIGYGQRGLVLRGLATGVEREVKVDPGMANTAGHVVWSPDGNALALTLALHPCWENWADSTSILLVETDTLEQRTLIQAYPRLFVTLEQPKPTRIVLEDEAGDLWTLNPVTGKLDKDQ